MSTTAAADAGRMSLHVRQTAWIAAPLALAQIGQMAMALTDTVMLGSVGPQALAAGSLGGNIFFTVLFALQGVLSGVGVLAARSLGAGEDAHVPRIYWTGALLALILAVPLFIGAGEMETLLRWAGESPALADDVSAYLRVLRWGAPAGVLGVGLMRVFLPAAGLERALLWVVPGAVALNFGLNQVLIHGLRLGAVTLPGFGMRGSAAATSVSLWVVALALLGLLHGRRAWRVFVVPHVPRLATMGSLLAIGLPVGATVLVELTMFLGTSFMAATMGSIALAAHMIVLSASSISFVVAFAISQAVNVRVASALGAGRPADARRAGFVAIGLGVAFMACSGCTMLSFGRAIVGFYLDVSSPDAAATAALAVRLLHIAALFQVADGIQTVSAGALRGMHDTRVPMVLAAFAYWLVGLPIAWLFGFWLGWGAVGLWWGMLAGLVCVAGCLAGRFVVKTGGWIASSKVL
jgi:MATE family multidrug resistance protein